MLVNMLEAKTQLSKLVEAALRGEEVIIANRGKPMVRLVKAEMPAKKRQWGQWEGLLTEEEIDRAFSKEADAEIAAELIANFERRAARAAALPPAPDSPFSAQPNKKAKRR